MNFNEIDNAIMAQGIFMFIKIMEILMSELNFFFT